ncbi:YhcN/YlaJ family sporulation lipoprotein [Lederbergia wuyishanensis]|uniref:YhcN/YlaJ family sporulation lipoprotein n=1 Tax=Lederbergia wuyishanensis TaxID=1347903 RepID=A0ABU0CZD6_9BACI|nr:YhcN/YlaJ family sporulation lipoprotein [Lederbergia wuyishanensis]MCJ8006132.1 YhcN/YlaJ family sporulation lipoprotein [Lederbergia wuyishanensis]MDQ0341501.1 YhcN/YlaJ family sporulation lipoprotein [Lederbergia wuyishanensis]
MRNAIFFIFIILITSACSQNNGQSQFNRDSEVMPQGVSVKNSHISINKNNQYTDDERANHLANLAAGIPNVHGATAVVLGNIAIVGIDVDANVDRSKVGTIKYSVAESLKHDPQGAGALVVADPDINARLREIRNDMAAGKPVQGIMNELSDIVGRIIPDAPTPEMGKNPENAVKKPRNQMNGKNDRQLENEQQEQSNEKK